MADQIPDSAKSVTITQADVTDADRAAVTAFHNIQIKRIIAGDKTLGDNRDVIEQAFARHRIEAEQRAISTAPPAMDREAVDFLGMVSRLTHSGDDGWAPSDADDAAHALDALIAKARTIASAVPGQSGDSIWDSYRLPCDVHLAPVTVIRAGCQLSTLKMAMEVPHRPKHFEGHPNAAFSTLSADAIRQGEGSDQAFIFDVLEALKTHFPRIAFCFARGTGGIEREDVLAILNDTKTASGVGKATTEVAALVQWARDQMALPDGSGYLGGHIDENHRYKLRDLVNAIDATSWRLVQRTGLGDLPSRIQGWIGKARKQGRDRIELDFETVELLVRLATPASHASDGGEA